MIAVIQRTTEASVTIDGEIKAVIGSGLVILLGIEDADNETDISWLSKKIVNLRIFNDENGVMNINCRDTAGEILAISQFTLHASTRKGNRPSYIKAAKPNIAIPLYEKFLKTIAEENGGRVFSGKFGADMKVKLVNDGPVTILIDTKNRK